MQRDYTFSLMFETGNQSGRTGIRTPVIGLEGRDDIQATLYAQSLRRESPLSVLQWSGTLVTTQGFSHCSPFPLISAVATSPRFYSGLLKELFSHIL